jgi:hypothetical protein
MVISYILNFPFRDNLTVGALDDLSWKNADLNKLNIAFSGILTLRVFVGNIAKPRTERMIAATEELIGHLEEISSQ